MFSDPHNSTNIKKTVWFLLKSYRKKNKRALGFVKKLTNYIIEEITNIYLKPILIMLVCIKYLLHKVQRWITFL